MTTIQDIPSADLIRPVRIPDADLIRPGRVDYASTLEAWSAVREQAERLEKRIDSWLVKGEGTCEQGQTAAQTGCTPASGEGREKPQKEEGEKQEKEESLDPLAADDPREVAEEQDKTNTPEYLYARKSKVGNIGRDILGSARHKRNAWRSLEDAEKEGTAKELVTRDKLMQNEPPEILSAINEGGTNSYAALAAHLALSTFPSSSESKKYLSDHPPEKRREQYYKAYKNLKGVAEVLAKREHDPVKVLKAFSDAVKLEVERIRRESNRFDPVANLLVATYKRTYYRGRGKNDVASQIAEFAEKVKELHGGMGLSYENGEPRYDSALLAKAAEHVKDVIEGASINKAFGGKAKERKGFDPSTFYSTKAERKGGQEIGGDAKKALAHMVDKQKMAGIQWGNSVTDNEREFHSQKAAEAFADLTDILGLPDEFASLLGKLGLAVGARGKGSTLAHYESESEGKPPTINLIRKGGVGSLAHEWGHFLDNILAGGKGDNFFSERNGLYGQSDPGDLGISFFKLAEVMKPFRKRLFLHVREEIRAGNMSEAKANYYMSTREMFARSFERHVQRKLHKADRENTYLVGLQKQGHPVWPSDEELDGGISEAFDNVIETFKRDKAAIGKMLGAFSVKGKYLNELCEQGETAAAQTGYGERLEKRIDSWLVKGEGTCEQGQTAAQTGCTPTSGEESKKPQTQVDETKNPESRATRILNAVVPEKVRAFASRVKKAALKKLVERYGEKMANRIVIAAMASVVIPVPGTQPATIAVSLIVAETLRAFGVIRGPEARAMAQSARNGEQSTYSESKSMPEQELNEEQIKAAAEEWVGGLAAMAEEEMVERENPSPGPSPFREKFGRTPKQKPVPRS